MGNQPYRTSRSSLNWLVGSEVLNKNKWIEDPENKGMFYSIKKSISGRHIKARISVFSPRYQVLGQVEELPQSVLQELKKTNPQALKDSQLTIARKNEERELEEVRQVIKRFSDGLI